MIHRRSLLLGLASAFAAPAIVRADALMKVRPWGMLAYDSLGKSYASYTTFANIVPPYDCIDIQAAMRRYAELFGVEHMLIGAR